MRTDLNEVHKLIGYEFEVNKVTVCRRFKLHKCVRMNKKVKMSTGSIVIKLQNESTGKLSGLIKCLVRVVDIWTLAEKVRKILRLLSSAKA